VNTFNIVIVDDYPAFGNKLAAMLETVPGVKVIGRAEDAASGVNRIIELRPHAAFVDVRLPDGTGFDVLSQIKKQAPRVTIVLMTAFTNDEYAERSRKLGADFFFEKSTGLREMLDAVRKLASGRRES
jgi:DNA-binding NarL/FixJ family response regulator